MLLTISTTHFPATDLGYLLHKNPTRVQSFPLTFGQAHVIYPEATPERCTVALILEIDPVGLVRGRQGSETSGPLEQYVNDRPYTASSFLSVALSEVFGTAMGGHSKDRPELARTPIPLEATLSAVPCRSGEAFLRRLFEPLGYTLEAEQQPLDLAFPEWGPSRYFTVRLGNTVRLADLLNHLYVLVPVLDNAKHYWVGEDEINKLLRHGEGWLQAHPERDIIAQRYLKNRRSLAQEALSRLLVAEVVEDVEEVSAPDTLAPVNERRDMHEQRLNAVLAELKQSGAHRVLDLGCGEGKLLRLLLNEPQFEAILGMDVSLRALDIAYARLHVDRLPRVKQDKIELIHGSLIYSDQRLRGYDAAAVVEVIEHLELHRLTTFERVVFMHARPETVVVTTPNREYNVRYPGLAEDTLRHVDHRFEWSRGEFAQWASRVAAEYGYGKRLEPIGPEDADLGAPSQMVVFTRRTEEQHEVQHS